MAAPRTSPGRSDSDVPELPDARPFDVSRHLRRLVPQRLARLGLSVDVTTDRREYAVGETVSIVIRLTNRLPVPIEVATEGPRIWGWTVDGLPAAREEHLHTVGPPNTLALRARETRTIRRTWDGRFRRDGNPERWIEATPGEYVIGAFVATADPRWDETRVRLR